MEFAKSAAGSAVAEAGAGAGAGAGAAGHPVEVTMWSLLADGADQRLVGNQFKQQLQDMMQKKLEQVDSDHKREADAAEAMTRQRSVSASSSGSMPDPLRLSGRDNLRGSGTATTLASAGSGLLVSFKGSLSELGVGVAADAAGEGGGGNGRRSRSGHGWRQRARRLSMEARGCQPQLEKPVVRAKGSGTRLGSRLAPAIVLHSCERCDAAWRH